MKVIKVLILLGFFTVFLFGSDTKDIAVNFLNFKHINKKIISEKEIKYNNKNVASLFNLEDGGYILVSLSKQFSPVKAYSFKDNFENLPKDYKNFILSELSLSVQSRSVDKKVLNRWDFLKNYQTSKYSVRSYIPNTNLLTTTWDQGYPYNKFYPKQDGQLTVAGCVQVAEAQIMRYHKYPAFARGSFKNSTGSVFLNRYYNWDNMPDTLKGAKEYQIDEVAYLMRDLSVVNEADLGVSGTSAFFNKEAFVYNFKYSKDLKYIAISDSISKEDFLNTLKSQIDKKLPVLLTLPGHMVVADGYQDDSSGNYIHLNMGWGGSDDSYYNLDETINTSSYTFGTDSLSMYYDIKPCSENDCVENLESTDQLTDTDINGRFDYTMDTDKYQLYLKGNTSFSGNRGYSNQAFYINIYDSEHNLIDSMSESKTLDLKPDLYTVEISLCSNNGCWGYDEDFSKYSVNILTDTLTSEEKDLVDENLDNKPVINNDFKEISLTKSETQKFLIYTYSKTDEKPDFKVLYDKNILEAVFDKNILTLTPKNIGFTTLRLKVNTEDQSTYHDISVLVSNSKIYFGKRFDISGTFENQDDYDEYSLFLEGTCSIAGTNGFLSQAFYTSLIGITDMDNTTITTPVLSKDSYILTASLNQNIDGSGYRYSYDKNHSDYIMSVNCPDSTVDLKYIASNLDIPTETTTKNLSLKKGWNLISADINLSKLTSDYELLWQYHDGKWSSYSSSKDLRDKLKDNNITLIQNILVSDGTWIKLKNDENLSVNNNITTDTVYQEGWTLAGTSINRNASDITCNNSSLQLVWKYKDNIWKLYLPDENYPDNIVNFDKIDANEAFWVKCTKQ